MSAVASRTVRVTESVWRSAASQHRNDVLNLIRPGLLTSSITPPSSHYLHHVLRHNNDKDDDEEFKALDPKHPVYNFLIEYYGLKGTKGTRRLMRWSPPTAILLRNSEKVETLEQLSSADPSCTTLPSSFQKSERNPEGKIILEGACEEDLGGLLHMRGAMIDQDGIAYSPAIFYGRNVPRQRTSPDSTACHDDHSHDDARRAVKAYLWYRAVLQQALTAEPVLYCHGLHEWAMLYHPDSAPPPPSGKYQSHLPKRATRTVINELVELRGVNCTHVDALRYFAAAAAPLNHHGCPLPRADQLRLEQPACVHANMDLLKIALRLQPFLDSQLLVRVLDVALQARRLDVAASPYDATAYGVGVVPVETPEGRALYRKEQAAIMEQAQIVRRDLLQAYDQFLYLSFDEAILEDATKAFPSTLLQTSFATA